MVMKYVVLLLGVLINCMLIGSLFDVKYGVLMIGSFVNEIGCVSRLSVFVGVSVMLLILMVVLVKCGVVYGVEVVSRML